MDAEFHYYINYFIAVSAGLPNEIANIISYSSQYVDDNTEAHYVKIKHNKFYQNQYSQKLDLLEPLENLEEIYCAFHFLPSFTTDSKRKDNKTHIFDSRPNSDLAEEIMSSVIQTNNPYLIGIASHAYADTWAHQNFTGTYDSYNAMNGFPAILIPNIGHADALDKPDIATLKWKDCRLKKQYINNSERYIEAASCIYKFYCRLSHSPRLTAEELQNILANIFGKDVRYYKFFTRALRERSRIRKYKKIIYNLTGVEVIKYDDSLWFNEAVHNDGFEMKFNSQDYKSYHWYKFQEAIESYKQYALGLIREYKNAYEGVCKYEKSDLL